MVFIKPRIHDEALEQIKVVEFLKQCTDLPYIHIRNEGYRSHYTANLANRMGLCSGVSDIFIPRANEVAHGMWLELKTGTNKLSDAQVKFIKRMNDEGYLAVAAWGAEAAIQLIKSHFHLEKNSID